MQNVYSDFGTCWLVRGISLRAERGFFRPLPCLQCGQWRNRSEFTLSPQLGHRHWLQRTAALAKVRCVFLHCERDQSRSVLIDAGENHISPISYKLFTKSAQSSGPENITLERPLPGHLAAWPVLSPTRITLENNGKIRPRPDRENDFAGASGGGDGSNVEPSLPAKSLNSLCRHVVLYPICCKGD